MILLLGAALIRQLYFNSKFQLKEYTKVFMGSLVVVCLMMIPRYFYLREAGSIWWSPIILEIIVSHLIIFVQMLVEYYTWNNKKTKWQKELMFMQQYESSDYTEGQLRDQLAQMEINPDSHVEVKDDYSKVKVLKLSPSYYTAAFMAAMKSSKQKLKMKEADQADLFYRSCFLYSIQIIFNMVLLWYAGLKPNFVRSTEINVALFFTVLLLHLTCLPTARDGLTMMKYALLHPEEFNHPVSAFVLGFFAISSMFLAEFVNIMSSQLKTSVADAIAGFIGFKAIIDVPTIYMNSHEDFPAKSLVGKLDCKRSRKERSKQSGDWLLNKVYVGINVFYKSVFFYFAPFATILYPMAISLQDNI
jgi:hypothetical protein